MASKPQRTSSRPCGRSPKGSCGPTATLHPTRRGSSARCSRPGTTACHGTAWCARTAASRWATSSGTCSQRRASRCATDAWTSHGRASPLPGETGARPTRHEDLIPQNAPRHGRCVRVGRESSCASAHLRGWGLADHVGYRKSPLPDHVCNEMRVVGRERRDGVPEMVGDPVERPSGGGSADSRTHAVGPRIRARGPIPAARRVSPCSARTRHA